jgi:hypothetical protein
MEKVGCGVQVALLEDQVDALQEFVWRPDEQDFGKKNLVLTALGVGDASVKGDTVQRWNVGTNPRSNGIGTCSGTHVLTQTGATPLLAFRVLEALVPKGRVVRSGGGSLWFRLVPGLATAGFRVQSRSKDGRWKVGRAFLTGLTESNILRSHLASRESIRDDANDSQKNEQ